MSLPWEEIVGPLGPPQDQPCATAWGPLAARFAQAILLAGGPMKFDDGNVHVKFDYDGSVSFVVGCYPLVDTDDVAFCGRREESGPHPDEATALIEFERLVVLAERLAALGAT